MIRAKPTQIRSKIEPNSIQSCTNLFVVHCNSSTPSSTVSVGYAMARFPLDTPYLQLRWTPEVHRDVQELQRSIRRVHHGTQYCRYPRDPINPPVRHLSTIHFLKHGTLHSSATEHDTLPQTSKTSLVSYTRQPQRENSRTNDNLGPLCDRD